MYVIYERFSHTDRACIVSNMHAFRYFHSNSNKKPITTIVSASHSCHGEKRKPDRRRRFYVGRQSRSSSPITTRVRAKAMCNREKTKRQHIFPRCLSVPFGAKSTGEKKSVREKKKQNKN